MTDQQGQQMGENNGDRIWLEMLQRHDTEIGNLNARLTGIEATQGTILSEVKQLRQPTDYPQLAIIILMALGMGATLIWSFIRPNSSNIDNLREFMVQEIREDREDAYNMGKRDQQLIDTRGWIRLHEVEHDRMWDDIKRNRGSIGG